jgi:hypothetical protein
VLIIRGVGRRQVQEELRAYARLANVKVFFQKKAWCDTTFYRWWLVHVFNKSIRDSGDLRDQLLFLDHYGVHNSAINVELARDLGVVPFFLAKNCTDVAAPVDHHVGCLLKVRMKKFYEKDLEKNYILWRGCGEEGVFSVLGASERRIKIAQWLDAAWSELRVMDVFLWRAFVSTGCLMGMRGENDIKMRSLEEPLLAEFRRFV